MLRAFNSSKKYQTRFLFWRWCNRSSRRHCLESSFRSAALHFTASVLITSMKRNRIDMFGICYVVDIDNEKQNVFLSHSLASFAFNNRNRLLFNCSTSGFQKQFTKCFVYLINYIRTQASENELWLEIGTSYSPTLVRRPLAVSRSSDVPLLCKVSAKVITDGGMP